MFPFVVADIGGTNARFALVTGKAGDQFQLGEIRIFNGGEYSTFSSALRAYLANLVDCRPTAACVAVAGPVAEGKARMTNLNWILNGEEIRTEFGFTKFEILNDFGALAVATSRLTPEDVIPVKSGTASITGNKAILGPGTGLGVAGLAYAGDSGWLTIPSEGGHVNVPPATALECEVIKAAMEQHGYVSAEMFVSGPGLINLYRALAAVKGMEPQIMEPQELTTRALGGTDALCHETLNMFCGFAGSVASNVALTYGAKGGVYLAGGILPRFVEFLRASPFSERFTQKGAMSHYVADIPVHIIGHEQTAFLGCATWLSQKL